jgi:prolycopene isomerase
MKDFDVAIIGSGLGGLSAAVNLARHGHKVLVLERHNVPGGYASSFVRGRFEFDVSLHELSGLGSKDAPGPLYGLLQEYGVISKVKFLPIPDFYRVLFPGVDVTVPVGRENFERALVEAFPSQVESIRRFTTLLFDFFMETAAANLLKNNPATMDLSKYPLMSQHMFSTVAEVVYPIVTDEKLRCVLTQIANYVGQPPSRLAFMTYALALASYIALGPYHVRGTSQALSQALVEVIEENHGQVWYNNGAAAIRTDRGKVTGVRAQDGTEIAVSRVVSNANPFETLVNLVGADRVPDWYLKRLSAWTPGLSTFNVWLGLDRSAQDLGFTCHETFVGFDYDLDKQYAEASQKALNLNPPGAAVTAYNLADAEFSPPGTSNVVITLAAYGAPWSKLNPKEYLEAKSRQADKAVEVAETLIPNIRKHIEVLEAATPLTNQRYTLNPGGSFTGFTEARHPGGGMQIPSRTPIEGLYLASAWVNLGGGYMPSLTNGYLASSDLMQDLAGAVHNTSALQEAMMRQTPAGQEVDLSRGARPRETLAGPFNQGLTFEVREIIPETSSAKTLRLAPKSGEAPAFRPGQYLSLFVNIDGVATSRAYSISSAPGAPYLDITVRRKANGFVSDFLLDRVKVGEDLKATGPHGNFFHDFIYDSSHLVLLAGGSGITPMMSIIREAVAARRDPRIHLLYGSRNPEDIIFKKELEALAKANSNLQVDFVISEPPAGYHGLTGFLDAALISSRVGTLTDRTFYLCGPSRMHTLCVAALQSLGVPGRRIKREAYGPPDDVRELAGWPGIDPSAEFDLVEERSGRTIRVKAGEPLMNGLEKAGLVVPAVCRSGECTACRTRMTAGRVFVPPTVAKRWIDEKAGFIHPCMSYPLDNLRIRL